MGHCWRCFYQQQRDVDSFLVANLVVIMGGIVQIIRREYFAQHPWENTSPSSGVLNSVYTWLRWDMTPQVTQAICLAYWVQIRITGCNVFWHLIVIKECFAQFLWIFQILVSWCHQRLACKICQAKIVENIVYYELTL